jgi:hypothetical protein
MSGAFSRACPGRNPTALSLGTKRYLGTKGYPTPFLPHGHGSLLRDQDRAPFGGQLGASTPNCLAYEAGAEALPGEGIFSWFLGARQPTGMSGCVKTRPMGCAAGALECGPPVDGLPLCPGQLAGRAWRRNGRAGASKLAEGKRQQAAALQKNLGPGAAAPAPL